MPAPSQPTGSTRTHVIQVDARAVWNRSALVLRKGVAYTFHVPPEARWKDWTISCGADGHDHWLTRPFKFLLRVPAIHGQPVRFFSLVGTLGERLDTAFVIGQQCTRTFTKDGELLCSANDVPWAYSNNRGSLPLTIDWIEPG